MTGRRRWTGQVGARDEGRVAGRAAVRTRAGAAAPACSELGAHCSGSG